MKTHIQNGGTSDAIVTFDEGGRCDFSGTFKRPELTETSLIE